MDSVEADTRRRRRRSIPNTVHFERDKKVGDLKVPVSRSALAVDKRIADQSPQGRRGPHFTRARQHLHAGRRRHEYHRRRWARKVSRWSIRVRPRCRTRFWLRSTNSPVRDRGAPAAKPTASAANCPGNLGLGQSLHEYDHQFAVRRRNPFATSSTPALRPEHIGGNQKIASRGFFSPRRRFRRGSRECRPRGLVVAHENVLVRMSAPAGKQPRRRQSRSRPIPISTNSASSRRISTVKP